LVWQDFIVLEIKLSIGQDEIKMNEIANKSV